MIKSTVLGEFFPNSALIRINFQKSDHDSFNDALDHFGDKLKYDPVQMSFQPSAANLLSNRSLNYLMTYSHELDHFRVFSSTPFGLLIWRIFQCIRVNVLYIDRVLSNVEYYKKLETPYLDWVFQNIDNLIIEIEDREYFGLVLNETVTYEKFISSLLDCNISIQEFVELANKSFELLSVRSGLPNRVKWKSNLDPETNIKTIYPAVSNLELIEAGARLRELVSLESIKHFNSDLYRDWYAKYIFGVYKNGFDYFVDNVGDLSISKIIIDVAFSTPIDIAGHSENSVILVEDVMPSIRVHRITEEIKKKVLPNTEGEINKLILDDICNDANIPSPRYTYENLLKSKLWGNAYWGGKLTKNNETFAKDMGSDELDILLGTRMYYKVMNESFLNNFDLRLKKSYFFIGHWKENTIEPPFVIYNDFVKLNILGKENFSEKDIAFMMQNYLVFCEHSLIVSLLTGNSTRNLIETDEIMMKEFENLFGADQSTKFDQKNGFILINSLKAAISQYSSVVREKIKLMDD